MYIFLAVLNCLQIEYTLPGPSILYKISSSAIEPVSQQYFPGYYKKDQKQQLLVIDQLKVYLENGMNNFELTPSTLSLNDITHSYRCGINKYHIKIFF